MLHILIHWAGLSRRPARLVLQHGNDEPRHKHKQFNPMVKLKHPFYLWSMLFFALTYLANNTRLVRFPYFLSRRGGLYQQRPRETTTAAAVDISSIKRPELSSLGLAGGVRPMIAVATCASSRNWEHLPFDAMSLVKLMLPSLLKTMESDRFQYKLFVGIDDDDNFWSNRLNQEKLRIEAKGQLELLFHSFPQPKAGHRIPLNEICKEAYEDGADYIVRINDDTEFVTPYWSSLGVKRLGSFNPPNVGVVGPTCHQGNLEILTHDMVHRTHMDIFESYYPKEFKNWYVDDWITLVYGKERTRMLGKWEVKHHIGYHGTRYEAHTPDLDGAVESGKRTLQQWLMHHT